jgi:hypothetical protein
MPVPLGNFEDIMEVVELDIQWSFCVSKWPFISYISECDFLIIKFKSEIYIG